MKQCRPVFSDGRQEEVQIGDMLVFSLHDTDPYKVKTSSAFRHKTQVKNSQFMILVSMNTKNVIFGSNMLLHLHYIVLTLYRKLNKPKVQEFYF